MRKAPYLSLLLLLATLIACSGPKQNPIGLNQQGLECYFFFIPECPASLNNIPKMNALQEKYQPQGIAFTAVLSEPEMSRESLDTFLAAHPLNLPVLMDDSLKIAKSHGAEVTPEVILYQNGQVMYSGALDDYYFSLSKHKNKIKERYLENAIEDCLAGRRVEVAYAKPVGCRINHDFFEE